MLRIAGTDLSKGFATIPWSPKDILFVILGMDVLLGHILNTTVGEFNLMVQEVKAVTCCCAKWDPLRLPASCSINNTRKHSLSWGYKEIKLPARNFKNVEVFHSCRSLTNNPVIIQ
jgi:hypothetical protein